MPHGVGEPQNHRLVQFRYIIVQCQPFPKPRTPNLSKNVWMLFNKAAGTEWDLREMARRHGLSYSRFRHRFREETGASPARYLAIRRLQAAARLLGTSDVPAQEIGASVGYSDPAHFSKAFKKHDGISPRAYRRSLSPFRSDAGLRGI